MPRSPERRIAAAYMFFERPAAKHVRTNCGPPLSPNGTNMNKFYVYLDEREQAPPISRVVLAQARAEAAERVLTETGNWWRKWRRVFVSVERR